MSRFGTSLVFYYAPGDILTGGTTLTLNENQMPQYPFESSNVTDRVSYRAKSGRLWSYQNYNLKVYTFNWSLLDETSRNSLKRMFDASPLVAVSSNGASLGTFRFADSAWSDQEVLNEFYDVNFTLEESA